MNEIKREVIVKNVKMMEVNAWDKLVVDTYERPYSFQQQNGCQCRGTFTLTIPSEFTDDENMHDEIPEVINGNIMGVKFDKWLARDPKQSINGDEMFIDLFWGRNFYPDIYTVANDLYEKNLIEAGTYVIDIDW